MLDADKIYDKLIEVAEDVSALRATYEEGKEHAQECARRNDSDHQKIFTALNGKMDKEHGEGLLHWVRDNPKFALLIIVLIGLGATNLGLNRLIINLVEGK
jgi:hypothetical protein